MDSPRFVPRIPSGVAQSNWYCLDCGEERKTEGDIRNHWRAAHPLEEREGENGVDYARGGQLILMRLRYEKWVAERAEMFMAEMYPGFGPDDFVAEAEIREA